VLVESGYRGCDRGEEELDHAEARGKVVPRGAAKTRAVNPLLAKSIRVSGLTNQATCACSRDPT